MIDREEIECSADGKGYEAYICEHLFENSMQAWHSATPTPDNRWPDAWCEKCNDVYVRDGEWTDDNSASLGVKLICSFCYERRRASSVTHDVRTP